ncbi:STAS domain-containing protein [Agitococcus lubricus]|uniref:Phospholipid transport system transporter-binding protein n=1 Tax=Agitococcus lubricus TaxID=1077255 RepID=A0A2T5J0P8_9GAMM|nr:STAS domain-containing protein [Agitococcus lubricus]PTQ89907.1 phospholipid transport system transporter-binding protein [Agitococcus lubricus]
MSNVATLTMQNTRLHLGGVVHFDNAEKVCQDGLELLKKSPNPLIVDMQALESSSSVVIAILLRWMRAANQAQQRLCIANMPDKLRAIVRVSGLTDAFSEVD